LVSINFVLLRMKGATMLMLLVALFTATLARQLLDTPSLDLQELEQEMDQRSEDELADEEAYQAVERKQALVVAGAARVVFKIFGKKSKGRRSVSSDITETQNMAAAVNRQTLDTTIVCKSSTAETSGEQILMKDDGISATFNKDLSEIPLIACTAWAGGKTADIMVGGQSAENWQNVYFNLQPTGVYVTDDSNDEWGALYAEWKSADE